MQNGTRESSGVALLLVDIQHDFITGSLAVPDAESILPVVKNLIESYPFDMIVASQDFHPAGHISFASSHPDGPGTFKEHKVPHPAKSDEKVDQMMWPDHCIQGTKGAEFHPIIQDAINTKRKENIPVHIIQKGTDKNIDGYSAFADNQYLGFTQLARILHSHRGKDKSSEKSIETIVVVGLATDYCVMSSAIDAKKFQFRTIVVGDAVRGVAKETTESAIREMQGWGIEYVQNEKDLYTLLASR